MEREIDGSRDMRDRAIARAKEILESYGTSHFCARCGTNPKAQFQHSPVLIAAPSAAGFYLEFALQKSPRL